MPQGLYIDLNDGRPPMAITAGMRCPSYCMTTTTSNANPVSVSGYKSGSQVLFIPRQSVFSYFDSGGGLMPRIDILNSVTFSGGSMTHRMWSNRKYNETERVFPGSVWQIFPVSSGNRGMLIQNSTDFTTITDGTVVGQCVYAAEITVNGSWNTPTISGFNRERYFVFARWNASGVVVDFDGFTIRVLRDWAGDDVSASVSMTVVIFASGVAPTPGRGLNIIASNGQCVFSTTRRPFVYSGSTYTPSFSSTNIGNRLVLLGRYGITNTENGGWAWLKFAGLVMQSNSVRLGGGAVQNSWTSDGGFVDNRATSLTVPLIDNIY
jgi:hypothetical protein